MLICLKNEKINKIYKKTINYILTLNKKASGMNELDKRMNDWNESRVEKVRIEKDIAKRRKKRKKELSTSDERRAIE
jgi:hypothetical protein